MSNTDITLKKTKGCRFIGTVEITAKNTKYGKVTLVITPYESEGSGKGDVNADGYVDNKDVVVLFRFISGASVTIDEIAADFNEDGSVDNKDVVSLFRYISSL